MSESKVIPGTETDSFDELKGISNVLNSDSPFIKGIILGIDPASPQGDISSISSMPRSIVNSSTSNTGE